MTIATHLLENLNDLGVEVQLSPCGRKIQIDAPEDALTPALLNRLKAEKPKIIEALRGDDRYPSETDFEAVRQWRNEIQQMRGGEIDEWVQWSGECRQNWAQSVLAIVRELQIETQLRPEIVWLEDIVDVGAIHV